MVPKVILLCVASVLIRLGLSPLVGGVAHGAEPAPSAQRLALDSPDGTIQVLINAQGELDYAVSVDGQTIVRPSRLGLRFRDGAVLGRDVELLKTAAGGTDTTWENPLGKRRRVRDHYRELRLVLREKSQPSRTFEVLLRAYNDGVAFRYVLPAQPGMESFILEQEQTEFVFAGDYACRAGQHENGFQGSQEWEFRPGRLSELKPESVIGSPLLVETPAAWVAVTESDLRDWAGMWFGGTAEVEGDAKADAGVTVVAKLAPRLDKQGLVQAGAPHQSPWRVLMIGRQPGRLVESDLILNLATPCVLEDPSWVQPGMMAWDWWSQISRMNTEGIKEIIDFAAEMGWQYMLIDAGWMGGGFGGRGSGRGTRPAGDITTVNPSLDMDEVRRVAKEKGVRLWLWLHWTSVDRDDAYKKGFPVYEQWGIAGVKIDFMDRDDQEMVNWYEKITRAAAEHHLMVDFHGAFKPCGFQRTFPNQVMREGILGNEYSRWSTRVTPEHKLTLPFTRHLSGPADFTPGGFLNRQPGKFRANVRPTQVQGTRSAELALFVLYENGAVCCTCDHPRDYRDQPGLDFLKVVPTVWDNTRVLEAEVAKYLVMARRSGDDWFLGAATDRTAREFPVKLDFLGQGNWMLRLWRDAPDSDVDAEHLEVVERVVTSADTVTLRLAPAGGCAARLQKEQK